MTSQNGRISCVRRRNLVALISQRFDGKVVSFSRTTGKAPSLISNILSNPPRKAFGEKLARSIEDTLALEAGWLDGEDTVVNDSGLAPSEEIFMLAVRNKIKEREIPAHVMRSILSLLEVTSSKHRMGLEAK